MLRAIFASTITYHRTVYSSQLMKYFDDDSNAGTIPINSNVGVGLVGAPACGDVMKIFIEVGSGGHITNSKYQVFGCGSAKASCSVATQEIIGKSLEDAGKLTNREIASILSLPPVKFHCSLLVEQGLEEAIKDYRNKNE